jgi:SPP1 gp7 family putative phage head morphogenesis protein
MSSYWARRIKEENERAARRTIKETDAELRKLYEQEANKLYNELLKVFAKIEKDSEDGKIYLNDLYRTNRIYELLDYFNRRAVILGGKQTKITQKALIKVYENAQQIVEANVPKSVVRPSFVVPTAVPTEQIVNQVWCVDGKSFSDRIWQSKKKLVNDLSKTLSDTLMSGENGFKAAEKVAARMGVDESAAYRIVRTETAHAQIAGQTDKYKELGFRNGIFKATDPCDECGELDGQLFSLEEIKTLIPRHPNCECSFLIDI